VAYKAEKNFGVHDPDLLKRKDKELFELNKTSFSLLYEWGTGAGFSLLHDIGALPVKNYTTNVFPEHERMNGKYMRTHFKIRSRPCHKCKLAHVKEVTGR